MFSCLKLITDFSWRLALESQELQPRAQHQILREHQPRAQHRQHREHHCVHQPGSSNLQTICSRKSCCCSSCLRSLAPSSPTHNNGFDFDDGSDQHHHHTKSPGNHPLNCAGSMKLRSRRCLSCFTSYSADCVAICCCPLAIPIFLFVTLPVLIFRRISARFRSRSKEELPSPYQRLGIDPRELRKPRTKLLKDEDVPFIGFGDDEHWKECFD